MEELRHELQEKRKLTDKIESQMGDLSLYSVKTQHYLELVRFSLAGAEVACENKNYTAALYYFGRVCTNLGGLLERGRRERACQPATPPTSSIPEKPTSTP